MFSTAPIAISLIRQVALAFALGGLIAGRVDAACETNQQLPNLIETTDVRLAWRAEPVSISVGEPFELEVAVCPAGASLISVDASMPLHRHGMNYRPSILQTDPNRWRVQGMVWHMTGQWQLVFSVRPASGNQAAPVVLKQDILLR